MMKAAIEAHARELGFSFVGFAPVDALPERVNLEQWLSLGYGGEMHWLYRDPAKRSDPHLAIAEARSVISLALNYYVDEQTAHDPDEGCISRYAWGTDYHEVMWEKLAQLWAFIQTQAPEAQGRYWVDTGPIMDKVWAARAGLGWQGKHSNLIIPQAGSWFFLGEIVTSLELVTQNPPAISSHCGSCTRCLSACPTGAIVAPQVVDARRCISYLTIELRGPIPHDLRPLIGNHVYGCDICQDVCPWNKFAQVTEEAAFAPRPGLLNPKLVELIQMDQESFSRRFKNSPIKRTKRRGLLRNVAVAIGNSGDRAAIPVLEAALSDHEPLIRGHVAWALGQFGEREALLERRKIEEETWVIEEIDFALSQTI